MFDVKSYYGKENDAVQSSYEDSLTRIAQIEKRTRDAAGEKAEYYRLFNSLAKKILEFADLERELSADYFAQKSEAELAGENEGFYAEILPENYGQSYANPAWMVKLFGDGIGQALAYWFVRYRQYVTFAFEHKLFEMERYNRLFADVVDYVETNEPDAGELVKLVTRIPREKTVEDLHLEAKQHLDPEFRHTRDIVEHSDLADLRYLYKYGTYVSDNERKIARFMASYPADKVKKLSAQIVAAYFKGFEREDKDITAKSTVRVVYNMGQERLARQLIADVEARGLKAIIETPSSTRPNRQYDFDHRFDRSLYTDEDYVNTTLEKDKQAFARCADLMGEMSGIIVIMKFGEKPFKPEAKPELLSFTPQQQKLMQFYQGNIFQLTNKYAPQAETSFTAISFPVPEIGENFPEVFEDILEINMLDAERYEELHQKIIDVLDKASFVHVKGKGDNATDITVRMHDIADPEKQTLFLNSGADINIPLGEVFTSPKLEGTSGTLHVKEAFLNQLRFSDLRLEFTDGYVTDYNCGNFDTDEENRKYVKENLLLPHDTLPVGEFAIGTNTLAYVIAQKHKIQDVLPVLILEKMGPHFAIGDTCFAHAEDKPSFNPNGKEIIARSNELADLRAEDPHKAYTNKHTDITLPYDSLEAITVVTKDGERIDIIRDGRFVVPGTEELNKPLEGMK